MAMVSDLGINIEFNSFPILDIDECTEERHECEQICHNSVGSYACSCHIGYRLDGDGLSCNGTTDLALRLCDQ